MKKRRLRGLALLVCIVVTSYGTRSGAFWKELTQPKYQEDCAQVDPRLEPRNRPAYHEIAITINDKPGGDKLSHNDLRLFGGAGPTLLRPIPIQFFRQEPVSIGIVVDTSLSMGSKIPQARSAIQEFIQSLNSADELFLFAFSDKAYLLQPPTTKHEEVIQRLGLFRAYGRTALYDSILDGLVMVSLSCYNMKALLVITDGMDTASTSSFDKVVAQAHKQQVPIYSIGIGNPNIPPASGIATVLGLPSLSGMAEMDRVDANLLQTLAQATGANTFIVREVGDGALLRKAATIIADRLGEKYTAGFVQPPDIAISDLKLQVASGKEVTAHLVGGGPVQVIPAAH